MHGHVSFYPSAPGLHLGVTVQLLLRMLPTQMLVTRLEAPQPSLHLYQLRGLASREPSGQLST